MPVIKLTFKWETFDEVKKYGVYTPLFFTSIYEWHDTCIIYEIIDSKECSSLYR